MKNKLDSLFFIPLFVPERHKQLLSQKKNRLREFFFALLRNKPLRNGGLLWI